MRVTRSRSRSNSLNSKSATTTNVALTSKTKWKTPQPPGKRVTQSRQTRRSAAKTRKQSDEVDAGSSDEEEDDDDNDDDVLSLGSSSSDDDAPSDDEGSDTNQAEDSESDEDSSDDDDAQSNSDILASILNRYPSGGSAPPTSSPAAAAEPVATASTTSTANRLDDGFGESKYFDLSSISRDSRQTDHVRSAPASEGAPVALKDSAVSSLLPSSGSARRQFSTAKEALTSFDQLQRSSRQRDPNAHHNLQAPTMTPALKKELQILQLRAYMDPKRFYKKDKQFEKKIPKTFEVGTFVDDVYDEYHKSKSLRKFRERDFKDTLLKDSKLKRYTKRKFGEIQATKQSGRRKRKNNNRRKKKK